MVQYSSRAIRGLAYLFRKYNDIEIYVEDATCKGMYEVLFERIMDGKAKVTRIFQLDGKHNVIETCKGDQSDTKRRRLYIIDGDFESVLGIKTESDLNYFYQLRVYCSENLLISKKAIEEIARESLPNVSKEEVSSIIELDKFLDEVESLVDLFALYLVAHKIKSSAIQGKTTGFNIYRLMENDKTAISYTKLESKKSEIRNQLRLDLSHSRFEKEFQRAKSLIRKSPLKFISGKSYLMPLLYSQLKVKAKLPGTIDQLKIRLARYCELGIDKGLVSAIMNEAQRRV